MENPGKLFALDPDLSQIWADFTEKSDEKCFRKFVKGFVAKWESDISPTWGKTVTTCLHSGYNVQLGELPDELLPALSKFLIISKDDADQGNIDAALVCKSRQIVKALTITCRQVENIELAASMNFVRTVTQMATLLLSSLLEIESMFFMRKSKKKAEEQTKTLRQEIIGFILQSCHFLESIYDPYFHWRAFMNGQQDKVENKEEHQLDLHQETIPFLYESFETALVECFPDIGLEMLIVLGAVISGSKSNAIRAVSPATSKMLLKTIRDSDSTSSQELHICAIFCSAKSIQVLHSAAMFERQVDINDVIDQYHSILKSLSDKEMSSLPTLIEGISVLAKVLKDIEKANELQTIFASNGTVQVLLDLLRDCKLNGDEKRTLLPVVIDTLSLLLCDCPLANEKMIKSQGYQELFAQVNGLGLPDATILQAILNMATHGSSKPKRFLKNIQPVLYLLKWLGETDYENASQQVWLCENLRSLAAANIQNKMLCCSSGLILRIVETLEKAHQRLDGKSAIELLLLLKSLGMHSITPLELKHVIGLLKDSFPFKSHVIHVLSSMSKGDGFVVCRQYFDISAKVEGLSVPQIRQWAGPVTGFSFHCWLRLDKLETFQQQRRQLYSFYTTSGNGFEAFVTSGGTFVVAVAHKKEFLAVPLEDGPLDDELWHCIDVCHSAAKRPFGSSLLQVYIDGAKRMECVLKYPSINEPISYCTIGSPLQRSNVPAVNFNQMAKPSLKEGLMDAIKIGVPGVFNLPQIKSGSNDPHIRWTLIGLEDQLWGRSVSLNGQIGMITCFQDSLSPHLVKVLHDMGPNNGLSFASEDSPEALDIHNRLVFFYSARACRGQVCPNLHPPHAYEAMVLGAKAYCSHDVKDVINCIGGGVHVIFPLLETALSANENASSSESESMNYMSLREDHEQDFIVAKSKKHSGRKKKHHHQPSSEMEQDWELLPSSSFSDWKLEQNPISGFLTLIKNFVSGHTINLEQLMRGGGVAIIGYLLSQAKPDLIDVNVLMASQLLIELAQGNQDQKLLHQIYQTILFDFRIWSRSQFHVQIGHIQYLSTLVKSDRKYFRRKFGVQYLLDVIRAHYSSRMQENEPILTSEDRKTIRVALFGLIKYFLQREVSAKEAQPLVSFLLTIKDDVVLSELMDMLNHYFESKTAKDQIFLIFFEAKKADLFYCLLLEKHLSRKTKLAILRLLTTLLQTTRVAHRHKVQRMHLLDARYLGLLHLRLKKCQTPLDEMEAAAYFDLMATFEDAATYQGILGLSHYLRSADIETKLCICRRLMRLLFSKNDAPSHFAKQIGWQECLASLLVKTRLRPELESSVSIDDVVSLDENVSLDNVAVSPTHYIEKATNAMATYLPSSMEATVVKASQKVADAGNKATETVYRTRERASSFLGAIRQRSGTLTSREDASRSHTPPYDPFSGVFDDRLSIDTRSTSTSSEDLRSESTITKPDTASLMESSVHEEDDEDHDLVALANTSSQDIDKEEELCGLLINILFIIMWRGGAADKERGCVIATINMLALDNNNELYKSHVELKRRIVELCIQAVLADMKDTSANYHEVMAKAEDVMQWAYDLIVLDPYGNFNRKISESLLDGILALTEALMVFSEGKEDLEWSEMAKMSFDILLTCAEKASGQEICTMATAKLHILVQTRSCSSNDENAFLLFKINKIIEANLDTDLYSYCLPIIKALLEKCKSSLNLSVQVPGLNLRLSNGGGADFYDFFKDYAKSEEWKYFMSKKVQPLSDNYWRGYLANLPTDMDVFWAECYELTKVLEHKRSRDIGESKLKFQAKYLEPYEMVGKTENMRFSNFLGQQKSYSSFIRKRWQMSKRQFFGPRGAWNDEQSTVWSEHWALASNENFERMRMKLIVNATFDPHLEASAQRDNGKLNTNQEGIFKLQLSKDAIISTAIEDSLTEEDLKSIAMEQMETAQEHASLNETEKAAERLVLSEDCQRVTYMSVVKGKLEVTTSFLYFFDGSPYKEDVERHDFRWSLTQIRELHLRRYNLRRTALEIFLIDQTNMFINFPSNRKRNKVYSKLLSLRPPNLIYSSSRSPADLLRSSGLTGKWVAREISNFEYLMQLNTIAGRTFNDLSQYPIFPWVICDYQSSKLNLDNPKTFRDLSKPIGIQNQKHVEEVRNKYDNFEDPSGTVAKFHYGTHYSNSAMVLHYLVRVEPFTSLHIDLQSGRFDVADRQFHSIPQTWKSLYDNVNDVKELIPEFFFFPEFLLNMNNFDLGQLQGGKKALVGDVILPKWATNVDDFIRKHRMALECDYVSEHLHHWIDLIFGYKQKGQEAATAMNVFYYCTYEGAVNLDAIEDPEEREAVEGMINNFGQTPCQLLKEPHPKRLNMDEAIGGKKRKIHTPSLMATMPDWKPYLLDLVASTDKDPVLYIHAPGWRRHFSQSTSDSSVITISSSGIVGIHQWKLANDNKSSDFVFDVDPTFLNSAGSANNAGQTKLLPSTFAPGLALSAHLFVATPDGKHIVSGGHWDNSVRVFSIHKGRYVASVVRHIDVVTCVAVCGHLVMSGSLDTTSIIWDISASITTLRPLQVLAGHDKSVKCVALSAELDMAASGSEDGTVNVYTIKEGQFLRTLKPPSSDWDFVVSKLTLSTQGHVVIGGHSKDVHSIHVYTINGRLLQSKVVLHRTTCLFVLDHEHILHGDENGELSIRDLYDGEIIHSLPLQMPIQGACLTSRNTHLLVPLRDGKLIVVGSKMIKL